MVKWSESALKNVETGKKIFESHPEQYTEERMQALKKDLLRIMPNASDEEREKVFFHSVYDYWVFGNNLREDIFYHFADKSDKEKAEYITFRNRFNYYFFLNSAEEEKIFKKKYDTYQRFQKWYKRDVIAIDGEHDYVKFSDFVDKHNVFFVKPESLGLGIGVHKVRLSDYNSKKEMFDELLKEQAISTDQSWAVGKQVVLEEPIIQRGEMAAFHPESVNMIRLTTVLVDGDVKLLDAWLRVGMNGSEIAAAMQGEIYCGVNLKSGIVETNGYTEFGDVFECHPDTGVRFSGYPIPRWNELIEMGMELAKVVPAVRYVGWDLALTDRGWVIIEGNENGEFLGQMVYGKPYKKMFESMINYHIRTVD